MHNYHSAPAKYLWMRGNEEWWSVERIARKFRFATVQNIKKGTHGGDKIQLVRGAGK